MPHPINEPNPIVVKAFKEYRQGRAIMYLSKRTKLSRITLTAWSKGSMPDLGVLLSKYFTGTKDGRDISRYLLKVLYPETAALLPFIPDTPEPPDEELEELVVEPIEFTSIKELILA